MHANLFDHYQDHPSPIHRLDPRLKVILTTLFILSLATLPDGAWLAYLGAGGLLLAALHLSGLNPGFVVRRSVVVLPFALAALATVFTLPGRPLWEISLGVWQIQASDTGLARFASILIRSWLSVQMAIVLTASTRFPDLLHALRHLHFPKILVAVIAFMYRYLFVLVDETLRLLRARASRSARTPGQTAGRSPAWRARVAGNMAGQLFLRSLDRSDRVYQAMLARGYAGEFLTLTPHRLQRRDWAWAAIAVALLAGLHGLARF